MKNNNFMKHDSQVFVLPLEHIQIHPQVLSISKPKKMDHIEYTMEKYKQLMPVLGNLVDGTFYITDGVLRYEVAKKLGMPTLKCLDSGTIDKDVIRVRMTSNQRSKMSYMEMATYAEHTLGVIGKSQGKKRNSWLGMEAIEDDDNFGLAGKDRFQLTCHLLDLPIKAASLRKLMAVKWFEDENPVQKILIWELSRIGRNSLEVLQILNQCNAMKVSIFIKNFNIETLDDKGHINPMTQFMLEIINTLNQLERNNIVQRLRSGFEQYRKSNPIGRKVGSFQTEEELLSKYPQVLKYLKKGLSIRQISKLTDKTSTNTILKVKKTAIKKGILTI